MAELFMPHKRGSISNKDLEFAVIANSQKLSIGDAVVIGNTTSTNQFVSGAQGSTGKILGVVDSFVPQAYLNSAASNVQTAEQGTITVASNNQTVAAIGIRYVPARLVNKWLATLDNPTATTTGSGSYGMFNMSGAVNGLAEQTFVVTNSGQSVGYTTAPGVASPYQFASIGGALSMGYVVGAPSNQVVGYFNIYV